MEVDVHELSLRQFIISYDELTAEESLEKAKAYDFPLNPPDSDWSELG
jgi:hypothetical protein